MNPRIFLAIVAVVTALMGLLMFLAPSLVAPSFGLAAGPATTVLLRGLGAMFLAVAVLNGLAVRGGAAEQRATLWTDLAAFTLGTLADLWGVAAGDVGFAGVAPGVVLGVLIVLGGLFYLVRRAG